MAKPKTFKPLLATKHDFVDSLDNVIQQAILLDQALRMLLDRGGLKPEITALLQERMEAFKYSIFEA